MPRKKVKDPEEMGEVERMLFDLEQQKKPATVTKTASKTPAKTAETKEPKPASVKVLKEAPEPFFTQQTKHKYGTCWKCGNARLNAGGVPGGFDTYHCHVCNQYLTIRHSRSDTARLAINYGKKG